MKKAVKSTKPIFIVPDGKSCGQGIDICEKEDLGCSTIFFLLEMRFK